MKLHYLTIALVLTLAAPVLGQTSPASNGTAQTRQPPAASGGGSPVTTQDLMRTNGGSLLRAQLAATPAESRNTLEAVSFFHVPAPQPRTIAKHDLVTIIIREESAASSNAKADITRESSLEAKLEEWVKLSIENLEIEGGGIGGIPPSVKASGTREFQGDGKLNRADRFIARIQAEVLDVKPNGTLVLQARKRIKTDEEEQFFVLSGTCRAEDVTADNSVLSTQLFDLELAKSTRGPIGDSVKRGRIHKFLDWLNPF